MDQLLTAQDILESDDLVIEKVSADEIKKGSIVFVRSITAAQRGEIEASGARFKQKMDRGKEDPFARDFTVRFAWLCLCDEKGNRLFTDIKDVAKLKEKNAAFISRVAEAGQRLSGFSKTDMDTLEKNSGETQQEDSPSD